VNRGREEAVSEPTKLDYATSKPPDAPSLWKVIAMWFVFSGILLILSGAAFYLIIMYLGWGVRY
jgi:hypothetical protein